MNKKIVWEFTNKRKLTAGEFIEYFDKKVKATIRRYNMPISKAKGNSLKARIINNIIKELPERKGKISPESLDNISNNILYIIMHNNKDKLKNLLPKNQPLYFLSDREILLYAKIRKINGRLENKQKGGKLKKIDNFIRTIEQKNPDIRHNIVTALLSYNSL